MNVETFKYFKYEIALNQPIPMPKPPIDYYVNDQYTVQQFLRILCKVHVGSLGKKDNKWCFGEDAPHDAKLGSRPDITQMFDFAEKLGIIVQSQAEGESGEGAFIPYKLSDAYWDKFDKYAQ